MTDDTQTPEDFEKELDAAIAELEEATATHSKEFNVHIQQAGSALAEIEEKLDTLTKEMVMLDSETPPGTDEEVQAVVQQLKEEIA